MYLSKKLIIVCALLPEAVKNKSNEEDDKEMVGVPEHFKVGPADDLHG